MSAAPKVAFLGIGAQKAATSWLHVQLTRHPQVWFPGIKELHFWDRRLGRSADDWLALFARDAPQEVAQGEITPAYALLEEDVIREIAAAAPELRIFYCLRNPIDRAWSAALMELGRVKRTEHDGEEEDAARLLAWLRDETSRRHGSYAASLRRWRNVFGEAATLVLWYEAIQREPRRVLERLAAHIGIDPGFYGSVPEASLGERVFCGPRRVLPREVRAELTEQYRDEIADLAELLSTDLSHWLEAPARA